MSISDEQFFDALKSLKAVGKRLKKCKPEQVKEINSAYKEWKAASKTLNQYFEEEWERRFGKPFPKEQNRKKGRGTAS